MDLGARPDTAPSGSASQTNSPECFLALQEHVHPACNKVSGPGAGSGTPLTADTDAEKGSTRRINGDSGWSVVPVGPIHVHAQAWSSWTPASVAVCFGSPLRPRRVMHPRGEESGVPETEKKKISRKKGCDRRTDRQRRVIARPFHIITRRLSGPL